MALIKNHKATIIFGCLINLAFVVLKFVVFLYTHVGLFFADAIDSFVDFFVIFLVLFFLRFQLNGHVSLPTKTFLEVDPCIFQGQSMEFHHRVPNCNHT